MDNIFIIMYQKPCVMGCNDIEIRLCKAYTREDAIKIATSHRDKYYKGWSVSVNSVIWGDDDTAYVYCDYK